MLGLLRKEIRINIKWLCCALMTLLFLNVLMSIMMIADDSSDSFKKMGLFVQGFFAVMGAMSFLINGAFSLNFVQSDERRKWGYYLCTVPRGREKQVLSTYILLLLMLFLTFAVTYGCNFAMRKYDSSVPSLRGLLMLLVCISLIMRAIEMPFIFAFGSKVGSQVKGGIMIMMILAAVIYLLFGDLSWIGTQDEIMEKFFKFIAEFDLSRITRSWAGVLVWASVPMYIISCFISMKVYMYGVERMEK